jgi:hypothetical protein
MHWFYSVSSIAKYVTSNDPRELYIIVSDLPGQLDICRRTIQLLASASQARHRHSYCMSIDCELRALHSSC